MSRARSGGIGAALLVVVALLFPGAHAEAVVSVIAVGEFAPIAVTTVGGPLVLANLDLAQHNLVALEAVREDDSAAFCEEYATGSCPLFWSPVVGFGGATEVVGLDDVVAGASYRFYCEIHPPMLGTLEVR